MKRAFPADAPPHILVITADVAAPAVDALVSALAAWAGATHVFSTINDAYQQHPARPDVLVLIGHTPGLPTLPWTPPPLTVALVSELAAPLPDADLVLPLGAPALLAANVPTAWARHRLWAAQQQQQHALDTLKNAIVRNVSHEMRTPLLQVKSAVAMLAEDLPDNRLVDYAVQATTRLEHVVLNLSHLADSFEVAQTPFMPGEVVQAALRSVRRTWAVRQAAERVQVCLDDDLPVVLGDPRSIAVVLQLLLDNALKFSQQAVTISAERGEHGVCFAVKDEGVGIPTELHQRIFDPFVQADASSTRTYNGLGVGLAVVQLILQRHNTPITLRSIPGQGSCFAFTLSASPTPLQADR